MAEVGTTNILESGISRSYLIQFLSGTAIWMVGLFIPNLASILGASNAMVGLIGGAYGLTILVSSYFFGFRADVEGALRYLRIGLLMSAVSAAVLAVAYDPLSLLIFYSVVGFSHGIYPAALVTYAYNVRASIGKFSALGSLGWTAGLAVAGLVATVYALGGVFLLGSLIFFLAFVVSFMLPKIEEVSVRAPLFPVGLMKRNIAVVLPFLLRHTGAWAVWIILPLYLIQLGADYFWISLIYAVNPLAQVAIMTFLTKRSGSLMLIQHGHIMSVLLFALFPLANVYWQVVPVMVLVALSWSFLYVGSLEWMVETNPERATAVGVLNSTLNLSTIVGSIAGGFISQTAGSYTSTMYFALALSTVGLILFRVLAKR